MKLEQSERRLAAILFTDIVGYTALMAESEEKGLRVRRRHREVVRPIVEKYHGESIEARGDESLSVFPTALDAVNCALAIEEQLREDPELKLHIGIHLGDLVVQDGEASGDGVNLASRICALSEGGGLCVSGEVYRSIRNQPEIETTALGERTLKNVPEPVAVYSVAGTPAPPRRVARSLAEPGRRNLRGAVLAAAALVAIALGLAWWLQRASPDVTPIRSIAVLPLENLSGDPEQQYFADGMTEALIGDLAKIGALRVTSRTSVMRYKNSDKSLPEIARELGVEGILEGSVMRAGERVRITAQLIDARDDQHIWADRFDRDLRDVLVLQSEIARSVAREIRVALTPEEGRQLSSAAAVEPAAHEAYLRGRYFWNQRRGQGLRRAIGYFERAIEEDPSYAAAYAGLADSYAGLPLVTTEPAREAMPRAEAAARRALAIDESLAEAHASLGLIRASYHWDWSGAEESLRRAIELDPRYAMAHGWYGAVLRATGRAREGLAEIERAHELDPISPVTNLTLGFAYLTEGDSERAIEMLLHTLELDPEFPLTQRQLAEAYLQHGEVEKALALAAQLNDNAAAWIYARAGRRVEALRRLEQSEHRSEREHGAAWPRALAYAALGDDERTFEWLERAYAAREPRLGLYLRTRPVLVPLYEDPRFQDLLRRMNFPGVP